MTRKRILGGAGYYIVAVLLAVIALVPFVWMISTSLKSRGALMSIPIEWIPAEPTLDAYGEVFSRFPFLKTIGNSLFITCSFTLLTIISASMAAFAFAKIRFRGSRLVLGLYLATMMIPTQVTMIPLFVVMNKLGLIDSYASVILPGIFKPFAVFMLVQQMRAIPEDFLDAARIDGAGNLPGLPAHSPAHVRADHRHAGRDDLHGELERLPLAAPHAHRPQQNDAADSALNAQRAV